MRTAIGGMVQMKILEKVGIFQRPMSKKLTLVISNRTWILGYNLTIVKYIASAHKAVSPSSSVAPMSIPITSPTSGAQRAGGIYLTVSDHDLSRGLSAPNTPMMKKTNLGVNKAELTKRRRAASSVSTANNSHIGTPQLLFPRSGSVSENLELLTWASTMDPIELEAIPQDERKRQEAIFELIATEKSYLNDLQMIINVRKKKKPHLVFGNTILINCILGLLYRLWKVPVARRA
jgi:hypothetical protein